MNELLLLCVLSGFGVVWGATATYLIRIRDNALQDEISLRSRYSSFDHVIEVAIAGFAGYLCGVCAYSLGGDPAVIVLAASAGSFLNRSALSLLTKYAPILADKYIHHRIDDEFGTDTTGLDFSTKFAMINRLDGDWDKLADYYEVPQSDRARWDRGREPHSLLIWIGNRDRMSELSAALTVIGRADLADLLQPVKKFE